jgi:uncharacterized membrane protein YkvA (DUF1232 family)
MEETTPHEMNDADFEDAMNDAGESGSNVSPDRANRFYDRIRKNIQSYVDSKGSALGKTAEYLLLVPDIFILLWRLANDARVNGKNKILLGSSLAYFIFPFDIIPEGFLGPVGFMDDLVFAVYVLNRVIGDTDVAAVREHWSGKQDILDTIQKVLASADQLVGSDFLKKVGKMMGKKEA